MPRTGRLTRVDLLATALIRRADLLRAGHSPDEIRAALRSGELIRVYAGVYRKPGADPLHDPSGVAREMELIQAVAGRASGTALAVSHRSAALVHGLPVLNSRQSVVHFTRNATSGGGAKGVRRVHARPLRDDEVVQVDRLRVTSIVRTCLDLGCTLSTREAVAVVDHALHRHLATPDQLAAALADTDRRVGIARARQAFRLADGRAESAGESFLRVVMHHLTLPAVELQVTVRGPRGSWLGRVDLAFPGCAVLIEFDGRTKYIKHRKPGQSVEEAVIAEKDRENRITECGYIVVRVVWADLHRPQELRERIERAMARGQRAVEAGLVVGTLTPESPLTISIVSTTEPDASIAG